MRTSARASAAVLAGFTAISFLFFGLRLVSHPGRAILGSGRDPQIFIWSFAWWPHAIGDRGEPVRLARDLRPGRDQPRLGDDGARAGARLRPRDDPVRPGRRLQPRCAADAGARRLDGVPPVPVPDGVALGLRRRRLPVRLLGLHARAAARPPAHDGGLPAAARRAHRRALRPRGARRARRRVAARSAARPAVLALDRALLHRDPRARRRPGARLRARPGRARRLRALVRPLLAGLAIAALVTGPLGVYAALGFTSDSINDPRLFDGDLLGFVVPTHLLGIGGATFASVAAHFPASDAERGAYLGLPTLLIAALFAGRVRRSPSARFLLASLGLAAFATLGTKLLVEGHVVVTLPWAALVRLPLFDNVLPVRFAAFTSLAAAVIVALWAAPRRGLERPRAACARRRLARARRLARRLPDGAGALALLLRRAVSRLHSARRERRDLPLRLLGQLDALAGRERLLVPDGGRLPPRPSRRRRSSPTRP